MLSELRNLDKFGVFLGFVSKRSILSLMVQAAAGCHVDEEAETDMLEADEEAEVGDGGFGSWVLA